MRSQPDIRQLLHQPIAFFQLPDFQLPLLQQH